MAVDRFPITTAELTGTFVQSILYGIVLVALFGVVKVHLKKSKKERSPKPNPFIAFAVFAMAIIGTVDVSLGFVHILEAFVYYTGPGGALGQLSNFHYWTVIVRGGDFVFQILIGDAMLIYRYWIVSSKAIKPVIFPMMTWTAAFVCGVAVVILGATLKDGDTLFSDRLGQFNNAFQAFSLAQNIIVTFLLSWKIWSVYKQTAQFFDSEGGGKNQSSLRHIMLTIIESGSIYCATLIIQVIVYARNSNSQIPVSDAVVEIIPIVFYLIIIRVHQGRTAEATMVTVSTIQWARNDTTASQAHHVSHVSGGDLARAHGDESQTQSSPKRDIVELP